MVLRVIVDGEPWLADVGFGGVGLLEPMPLREGGAPPQVGLTYSLRRDGMMWILSCTGSEPSDLDVSVDLYEFSEDPQTPGDIEVANHPEVGVRSLEVEPGLIGRWQNEDTKCAGFADA